VQGTRHVLRQFCLIHEPADRDVNVSTPAIRQPKPTFAHEVDSRHVLFRFAFRLIVLTVFASLGTRGFGPAFAAHWLDTVTAGRVGG